MFARFAGTPVPSTFTLGPMACELMVAPTAITEGAVAGEEMLLKRGIVVAVVAIVAGGDHHHDGLGRILEGGGRAGRMACWQERRKPRRYPAVR